MSQMWPSIDCYYKQTSSEGTTLFFQCLLCSPRQKIIRASTTSASNLRTHIKKIHPFKLNDFNKKMERKGSKRKEKDNIDDADDEDVKYNLKQAKLQQSFTAAEYQCQSSTREDKIHRAVLKFVVGTGSAFSVVEHPDFVDLIKACGNGSSACVPPNRKQLIKSMENSFIEMKGNLKETLKNVSTVCTTADCWTVFKRSYLGMTVHWLDKETLERQSKGLSCKRIFGRHTYEVIADAIEGILDEFQIKNKTSVIITDNGSNFLKAFRVFGRPSPNEENENDAGTDNEILEEAVEMTAILDNSEDYGRLPQHQSCASHNLNLLSLTASEEAVANSAYYKRTSRQVFAKCQALFNKQNKSSVAGDIIKNHLGRYLLVPAATRWNTFFDAINMILNKEEMLDVLCKDLELPTFKRPQDIEFLKEFCKVMEPVASALDILQGEKQMYMGYLLPTLSVVKLKLCNITDLTYCNPLKEALCSGFEKRFSKYFKQRELRISACLIPRFKLNWVNENEKTTLRQELLQEFENETKELPSKTVTVTPQT